MAEETWKSLFERHWTFINRQTVNGSDPRWTNPICYQYLAAEVQLEMTKDEFANWCYEQRSRIEQMHRDAGLASDSKLLPTIVRIDLNGHFSLDNIRLLSIGDEARSSAYEHNDAQ